MTSKEPARDASRGVEGFISELRAIVTKVYGTPPAPGAPKAERLRWVRRTAYLSNLRGILLVTVTAALVGIGSWFWVLLGISSLCWVIGFVTINVQLRRADAATADNPAWRAHPPAQPDCRFRLPRPSPFCLKPAAHDHEAGTTAVWLVPRINSRSTSA
jgi:hypothetical protein